MCLKPRGARLNFQGNSAWAKYRSGSVPWSFFAPQPHGNACYAGYSQGDQSQKLHSGSFCGTFLGYQAEKYDRKLLVPLIMGEKSFKPRPQNRIFFQSFRRTSLPFYKFIWEFAPPRGGFGQPFPTNHVESCHFIKLYGSLLPPGGGGVWLALPNKSCSQLFPKGNDIMRAKPRHFMQTAVVFIA